MKNLLIFILLFMPLFVYGQIISTVAGNGVNASTGDGGLATLAAIYFPGNIAFDGVGNCYFEQYDYRIRKISPSGIISTIAGNGIAGFSGDGSLATSGQINTSGGVAADSVGNIYIADMYNQRIRRVDVATGIISTYGGNGIMGFSGDGGQATAAELTTPAYLCIDNNGNLYFPDETNFRIRKINAAGIISTVAGTGVGGSSGDGGQATAAQLHYTAGLRTDHIGNLFFSDNNKVRKIDMATGIITTVAGTGFSGDGGPATNATFFLVQDVAVDIIGNLYICDNDNSRIRKVSTSGVISTLVGDGLSSFSGDGGPSTSAELNNAQGIAVNMCGDLFICDLNNNRIRKVTFPTTTPTITLSLPVVSAIDSTVTVTASVTGGCCHDTIAWMNNGMVFATTTAHTVSYVKTAAYDTITARVVGCGDSATSVVHVVTATNVGVPGMQLQAGIRLWPNPASNMITISAANPICNVAFTNLQGQTVLIKEGATKKMVIDVGQLHAGVYVIKVVDSEGNTMLKQLVKE